MRITIDSEKCIAAGACVMEAFEVFDQRDEDGVVILLDAEPDPSQHTNVRRAAAACPARAIAISG
ncbi:ferredoxin [Arthrobacter sp. NPDC089319]|uniref:ferredoxin n=1 Tax=Arthrobacter sp. NPDC089319 TaxID=3155915 RepID=UPI003442A493